MEAKLTYVSGMKFVGEASSGHAIVVDGEREHGGDNVGLRPSELLLIALGGCSAMDVISIMKKKKQHITSFEINVNGNKVDTHPKKFDKIVVEYVFKGKDISEEAVQRAVELSMTKYCSVKATLEGGVPIEYTYKVINE
ncbi:MAG: OsmC family protein [Nitrospirae bacterium]|nr:OsmC family protein [Nitrospirota bacterium]